MLQAFLISAHNAGKWMHWQLCSPGKEP